MAVLAVAAALGVRLALDPLLGNRILYATFFAGVAATAWLAGGRAGLLAILLSALCADYFLVQPRYSLLFATVEDGIGMGMFLSVSLAIVAFGEAMHRARARAEVRSETLRITLTSIGDAVIATDKQGRVILMNPVAVALTGWTEEAAQGQPLEMVFRIVNEATRKPVENPVQKVLSEGRMVGLANHTVLIARDGTERSIDDSAAPIREASGQLVGVVLIFRDITERRNQERQLSASETQFRSAFETPAVGMAQIDPVTKRFLRVNQKFCAITGYSAPELLEMTLPQLNYPEDNQADLMRFEAMVRGETAVYQNEKRYQCKDASVIWVEVTGSVLRDGQGRPMQTVAIIQDITERKRSAEQLLQLTAESERWRRLYDTILSNTPDLVYVFDLQHRFTFANQALLTMWGRTWAEAIGKNCLELGYEPWHAEMHDREIDQVVATKQAVRGVVPFNGTHGRRIYDYIFVPVLGDGGEVEAVAGTTRDVTDWKRAEEALRQADRRKDEFLAILAHELRNPLAPIRNAVHLLKINGSPDPSLNTARDVIDRQVQQMVLLIEDLLDISRITLNKLDLRLQQVELTSVIHHALEMARPYAESAGHQVTLQLPAEPLYLHADPTRLSQIFGNLLTNACKYTEKGGRILLTAQRNENAVVVSVKDNGIGISAADLPRLFEKFSQVAPALERSQGGLGIGLSLVRGLVEMHGGSVTAASGGLGQGSEFVVELPLLLEPVKPPQPEMTRGEQMRPTMAARFLVVDDNRDSADSLAMVLQLTGKEVRTVYDGLEAVKTAGQFLPEVILLDLGMPKLNGYEACREIRRQPWGKSMILIAQTGWGQEDDKRRTVEAGFDGHLVKPVDPDALARLLADLLPAAPAS